MVNSAGSDQAEDHVSALARGGYRLPAVVVAFFVLLVGLIAASAAFGEGDEPESPPPPAITPQLVQEGLESPTVDMAEPDPNAEASHELPHRGLDRGEALELLDAVFGEQIEDPGGIFDGLEVDAYLSDHAAVASTTALSDRAPGLSEEPQSPPPEPTLIESTLPLRTETEEGVKVPVDLSLEHSEGELQPESPLVKTEIPTELEKGISLANSTVTLEFPQAAGERAPTTVEGNAAFYPNVESDTDLLVAPTPTGVETWTQLRSAEAPQTQRVHLNLPSGAALDETDIGGVAARLNGRVVLNVPPPTATAANGQAVPVAMSAQGDEVEITVSPAADTAYPILVDPTWEVESWNWIWGTSSFSSWTPYTTTPSYQALNYGYPATGNRAIDMTSGLGGSAPWWTHAEWYFGVPRFASDQTKYGERPKSFIDSAQLEAAMFLLQGNSSYWPIEEAGIIDESKGEWVSVGSHSGTEGEVSGWSGKYWYPNEMPSHEPDTNAKIFTFQLVTLENEEPAKYRTALAGEASVSFSDHNSPFFSELQRPGVWMNKAETVPITYTATDEGLGVYEFQVSRNVLSAGNESTHLEKSSYKVGCIGIPSSACPRVAKSTEAGRPVLAMRPEALPEGYNTIKVAATDPLGTEITGPYLGGSGETYSHVSTEESVPVKIDHSPPTLALSGTLTEQATQGTALPQYKLKYSAGDGGREAATIQSAFGTEGSGNNQFKHPADVALDPQESKWVADQANNRLEKFNSNGQFVAAYGTAGAGNGQLNAPSGIAADESGNIWVADTGNNRIEKFNSEGKYASQFGSAGTGNGQFSSPKGIAIAPSGNIWVADTGNNRIEKFSSSGAFLAAYGAKGSGNLQFSEPGALDVASNGNVWVADSGNNRVEVLSGGGEFVATYGSLGSGTGRFNRPAGIDVDEKGNVYVLDANNARVEQFSERGEYLSQFGSAGTGSGQLNVSGAAGLATNFGGEIWVADSANNRIEEWNPPKGTRSGVRKVTVKMDGKVVQEPTVTCPQGGCPLAGEWALHAGEYAAGAHTVEVIATDGVELAKSEKLNITLNPPAPTLSVSGTLTEQESLGTALPHYTLKLSALANQGTGVVEPEMSRISTEITVDGKKRDSGEAKCSTEACAIGREWTLNSGEYAAGSHTVVVKATDRFGYSTSKTLNITLNPPAPSITLSGSMTEQATLGTTRPQYVLKMNASAEEGGSPRPFPVYRAAFGSRGSGNGQFGILTDIAVSPTDGSLWAADDGNNRIEHLTSSGEYLGQIACEAADAVTVDAQGNVYAACRNTILKFSSNGSVLKEIATGGPGAGHVLFPTGLAIDGQGNLWVADTENDRVDEFSPDGKFVKSVYLGVNSGPWGVSVSENGNIWVAEGFHDRVSAFNQKGELQIRFGTSGSGDGEFLRPSDIQVDEQGYVWVTDAGSDRVEIFTQGGQFVDSFGSKGTGEAQFNTEWWLRVAVAKNGDVWVADEANARIEKWQAVNDATTYVSAFGSTGSGNGQFNHPAGIAVDSKGDVWVADRFGYRVEEFSESGSYLGSIGSRGVGPGQFEGPTDVAIDPQGNIWVTDATDSRLEEFNEKGEFIKAVGSYGTGHLQFNVPETLTIGPNGNIWVGDTYNSRVVELNEKGEYVQTIGSRGTSPAQLLEPSGIAIGPGGTVWVADWGSQRIKEWHENGNFVNQYGGEGTGNGEFERPDVIDVDALGHVWVGDQSNSRVQELSQSGEYMGQFGTAGSGSGQFSFRWPMGIAADSKGNIWVSDTENNRVERWKPPTRSRVRTEITLDGKKVDGAEASCGTESCPISREWTLNASPGLVGSHTIVAKATDGYGQWTTKTRTIEIQPDTTKPTIEKGGELGNAPEGWVQQESYGFHATAKDPAGYGATSLIFRIDGATVASKEQPCPAGACEVEISKGISMAPYSGGAHEAELIATDGAGNTATKEWTINVDPEGHISTAEATATMEAVEETSESNLVGHSKEEGLSGTAPGLELEATESGFEATGTYAPMSVASSAEGPMTVEIPTGRELYGCGQGTGEAESEAEEVAKGPTEEECIPNLGEGGGEPGAVKITPQETQGSAAQPRLIEGNATVSADTGNGTDSVVRPLNDGGMIFQAIRDDLAPETYTFKVNLGDEQILRTVDETHAEVYYTGHLPAFSISAVPAHDAIGTAVPTTLTVSGSDTITLHVHYKEGHEGQPYVYPMVSGTGWEGGFHTTVVDMDNPPPEEPEEGEETVTPVESFYVSPPEASTPQNAGITDLAMISRARTNTSRRFFRWIRCGAFPVYWTGRFGEDGFSCGNPFIQEEGSADAAYSFGVRGWFYVSPGNFVKHRGTATDEIECRRQNFPNHFEGKLTEPEMWINPAKKCLWWGQTSNGGGDFAPLGKHLSAYGEWDTGEGERGGGHSNDVVGSAIYLWSTSGGYRVERHKTTCIDC